MEQIIVKNINDFKSFNYSYVIQSNFVKSKKYNIGEYVIEGINTEHYLEYAIYNGEELLQEVSNYGEMLYEHLANYLILDTKKYLQESSKKHKKYNDIGVRIPFGMREDKFYIVFRFKKIRNATFKIIKSWCKNYGFPIRSKDMDKISQTGKEIDTVVDIIQMNQLSHKNTHIGVGTIDEMVVQFMIIYLVNDLWKSLGKINFSIKELEKCNKKLKNQEEVSTSEIYKYKSNLNKSIEYINGNELSISKLNKIESTELQQQRKEIQILKKQLIEYKKAFSLILSEYCYKFETNLTKQIIYQNSKQIFLPIMVSDSILDLAWNLLISKICTPLTKIKAKICKDCGNEFIPVGNNQFRCENCKNKNENHRTTTYDEQRRSYQDNAKKILQTNQKLPRLTKKALIEIINTPYRKLSINEPEVLKNFK